MVKGRVRTGVHHPQARSVIWTFQYLTWTVGDGLKRINSPGAVSRSRLVRCGARTRFGLSGLSAAGFHYILSTTFYYTVSCLPCTTPSENRDFFWDTCMSDKIHWKKNNSLEKNTNYFDQKKEFGPSWRTVEHQPSAPTGIPERISRSSDHEMSLALPFWRLLWTFWIRIRVSNLDPRTNWIRISIWICIWHPNQKERSGSKNRTRIHNANQGPRI